MNALELSASIKDNYFATWEKIGKSVAKNGEMYIISIFSRKISEQGLFHRGLHIELSYPGYLTRVQCYHIGDTVVKSFYANIRAKG